MRIYDAVFVGLEYNIPDFKILDSKIQAPKYKLPKIIYRTEIKIKNTYLRVMEPVLRYDDRENVPCLQSFQRTFYLVNAEVPGW